MEHKFCTSTPSISAEQRKFFIDDFFSGFNKLKENASQTTTSSTLAPPPEIKVSGQQNKQAALSSYEVAMVKRRARTVTRHHEFSSDEKKMWNMILACNKLAQDISSSDLPTDEEKITVLVKLTQDFADKILRDPKKTWLDKILEIAVHTKKTEYGNCQEKAFFGFAALMLESQKNNSLIHTLRLATFNNHFIVIVNESMLMDPWLNLAFPVDLNHYKNNIGYVFKGFGDLIDYFTLYSDGECVTHQVLEGSLSCSDIDSTRGFSQSCQMLISHQEYFHLPNTSETEHKQKKKRHLDLDEECSATSEEPREKTYVRGTNSSTTTNHRTSPLRNPEEILLEDDDTMAHEPQTSFSHPTDQKSPVFSSLFPISNPFSLPNIAKETTESASPCHI